MINQDICKLCGKTLQKEICSSCGAITPRRQVNDKNINANFMDYSYNNYTNGTLEKLYSIWTKLNVSIFLQRSILFSIIGFFLTPLIGGRPRIDFLVSEKYLDVGCGRGEFMKYLPITWEKTGIEIVNYDNPLVIAANFESYEENFQYSVVRSWHSLEHAIEPIRFIQKLVRHTQPNGIIVISTPNANSLSARFFGRYWLPRNVDSHFCILTIDGITNELIKNECEILYKGTYTLFSSAESLAKLLGLKSCPIYLFIIFNILMLPLTLLELLSGKADSLIIYARKL